MSDQLGSTHSEPYSGKQQVKYKAFARSNREGEKTLVENLVKNFHH